MDEETHIVERARNIVFSKAGLSYPNIERTVEVLRRRKTSMKGEEFLGWLEELSLEAMMRETLIP